MEHMTLTELREEFHRLGFQRREAKKAQRGKQGLMRDFFQSLEKELTTKICTLVKQIRTKKKGS